MVRLLTYLSLFSFLLLCGCTDDDGDNLPADPTLEPVVVINEGDGVENVVIGDQLQFVVTFQAPNELDRILVEEVIGNNSRTLYFEDNFTTPTSFVLDYTYEVAGSSGFEATLIFRAIDRLGRMEFKAVFFDIIRNTEIIRHSNAFTATLPPDTRGFLGLDALANHIFAENLNDLTAEERLDLVFRADNGTITLLAPRLAPDIGNAPATNTYFHKLEISEKPSAITFQTADTDSLLFLRGEIGTNNIVQLSEGDFILFETNDFRRGLLRLSLLSISENADSSVTYAADVEWIISRFPYL